MDSSAARNYFMQRAPAAQETCLFLLFIVKVAYCSTIKLQHKENMGPKQRAREIETKAQSHRTKKGVLSCLREEKMKTDSESDRQPG